MKCEGMGIGAERLEMVDRHFVPVDRAGALEMVDRRGAPGDLQEIYNAVIYHLQRSDLQRSDLKKIKLC